MLAARILALVLLAAASPAGAQNRSQLIGLSVLVLTATITMALAQNTSNPMLSRNTTNPILSGNTVNHPPSSCFSGASQKIPSPQLDGAVARVKARHHVLTPLAASRRRGRQHRPSGAASHSKEAGRNGNHGPPNPRQRRQT